MVSAAAIHTLPVASNLVAPLLLQIAIHPEELPLILQQELVAVLILLLAVLNDLMIQHSE